MSIANAVRACLAAIAEFILPFRGRTARLRSYSSEDVPIVPMARDVRGRHILTLMDYDEPIVEDLIRALKYDGSARAASYCAAFLAEYLREEIGSAHPFLAHTILLVPIPLHRTRVAERGFNQIEMVLKRLPEEFRDGALSELAFSVLGRIRATPQQTRLSRDERMKNVVDAFKVIRPDHVHGAHVYLIDDVMTTGATLINAAEPLEAAGASVTLLAFARA